MNYKPTILIQYNRKDCSGAWYDEEGETFDTVEEALEVMRFRKDVHPDRAFRIISKFVETL